MPTADSNRHEPAKPPYPFVPRDPIIYMHIFARENDDTVIRTRTHEKIKLDFFRAKSVYVLYIAGKNIKIVRCDCAYARSTHRFFTSFEQSMVGKCGS
jgi:hypothetical protein|nr:MAG TPA: hypothetical protein [Caudoviricetes sp.]